MSPDWYHWLRLIVPECVSEIMGRRREKEKDVLESPPLGKVLLKTVGTPIWAYNIVDYILRTSIDQRERRTREIMQEMQQLGDITRKLSTILRRFILLYTEISISRFAKEANTNPKK